MNKNKTRDFIPESNFGLWFLSTGTWVRYVVSVAVYEFSMLLKQSPSYTPKNILDIGCGQGSAFKLIEQTWQPNTITGIDIDPRVINKAQKASLECRTPIRVEHQNGANTSFKNNEFDLILCHQVLHHSSDQHAILTEIQRILSPGGKLLIAESCSSFIHSWTVRYLFRHPQHSQHSAKGFVELVKNAGFDIDEEQIQTSSPWWSRPDLGLFEKLGLFKTGKEPTEVLFIAHKKGA